MAVETVNADEPWTVRRVLDWTIGYLKEHGSDNPRLDAEVLLAHSRKCQRIQLYTQYDELLTEEQRGLMRSLVKRRAGAEPVAYLVGHREFFSLDFEIDRDVFIPRPDTETLVAATLDLIKSLESPRVLELCTGSGCVPIAIAKNHSTAQVTTIEKNPTPYAVAQRNVAKHAVEQRVRLLQGDLFEPVQRESGFHVIVSNPPYVTTSEVATLDENVRNHEPHAALDGGQDGLDIIRRLVAESPDFLVPGGWLLFELDPRQSEPACQLLRDRGFERVGIKADLSGQARVVLGCWRVESSV